MESMNRLEVEVWQVQPSQSGTSQPDLANKLRSHEGHKPSRANTLTSVTVNTTVNGNLEEGHSCDPLLCRCEDRITSINL